MRLGNGPWRTENFLLDKLIAKAILGDLHLFRRNSSGIIWRPSSEENVVQGAERAALSIPSAAAMQTSGDYVEIITC
jgi:hypothetical protein